MSYIFSFAACWNVPRLRRPKAKVRHLQVQQGLLHSYNPWRKTQKKGTTCNKENVPLPLNVNDSSDDQLVVIPPTQIHSYELVLSWSAGNVETISVGSFTDLLQC